MIRFRQVTKLYGDPGNPVRALDGISLEIGAGEFAAVVGPSGCGKSTLLHLLGGLDRPTAGSVEVGGLRLEAADEASLTRFRRRDLGMVFQFFHLLPTMTVAENIALPLLLQGAAEKSARARAGELLGLVGLVPRADHFPHQLSGGEMQRTAVARALAHRPSLLLADEPTGNLDSAAAEQVLGLLREIHRQRLATLVVVTHSRHVAEAASRVIALRDGRLVDAEGR